MEAQLEEKNQELQRVRVPAGRTRLGCRPVYRRVCACVAPSAGLGTRLLRSRARGGRP